MKRLLTLIISASLTMMTLYAQTSPTGINYQAVARDNSGTEISNRSIEVKFSILENSYTGTLVWEEKQTTTTNTFGLFTVTIGQTANRNAGVVNFDSIKWGNGSHYLKVEVDFGDNNFINMGTTQMLAVPYALYAKTAGNAGGSSTQQITYDPVTKKLSVNGREIADFSTIGANAVQGINLDGNLLSYSQNGQTYNIDLSKYLDNTDKQNLSIQGHTLKIENGNFIT